MRSPSTHDPFRQQFEQRMRLRRASTCVAAARGALADGRLVEAKARLDEACTLDPENTDARLLHEELESIEALAVSDGRPSQPDADTGWAHWVAVAIAIAALATLAFLWPPRPEVAHPGGSPARGNPRDGGASRPVFAERLDPGSQPAPLADQPGEPGGSALPIGTSGARQPAMSPPVPGAPAVREGDETPAARLGDRPARALAPPAAAENPTAPSERAPLLPTSAPPLPLSLPSVTVPNETRVSDAAVDRATTSEASPAIPVPALAEAPASDPVAADVESVRATLNRYRDAYSRLDAHSAHEVWPSVDQAALQRAFAGLSSQGIEFDRCDVTVQADEANAECNGRASYVRKVGTREPLTERRQWVFRLRRAGERWEIVWAEAK